MNTQLTQTSGLNRRSMLKSGMAAALGTVFWPVLAGRAADEVATKPATVPLKEKFIGCIVGCHLGSAMAAPVEGWSWQRIEKEHGTLDRLLSYEHYRNGWKREPGTTEDGVERQKLMITAIIEKQDRVNAEDIRSIWLRDIKPESAGMVSEPFEATLLAMAKSGIPATDLGRYCDYAGLISVARSCHPIGLINAGDVASAIEDIREVAQLYQTANSRGVRWAEVTMVGIAAATVPGATVDSVLGAIFDRCDRPIGRGDKPLGIVREIERGLKLTAGCQDFKEMRQAFDPVYSGQGIPYAQSYANEVVTKAVCVFKLARGNTWEALKAGVNMGRDTDCLTAIAAGLTGALAGADSIPKELIAQVDHATRLNQYTNSQRTLRETSDGLHQAFKTRLSRMKEFAARMDAA